MRALVFDDDLKLETAYTDPTPADEQVLIRVTKAGICNTDLELVKGYMGFSGVLGHEFAGVVERGPDDWAGRRVAGEINLACYDCGVCHGGAPSQCPNRTTLGIDRHDGAFADYLTLPVENLHSLPDTVSDDAGVFVEPLAAALQVLERRPILPHERAVVLGDGKLGLLTAQVVALTGCRLTLVGRHADKLALAEKWSIQTAGEGELSANSADVVVDCTGQASGFEAALDIVRPRGDIVLKSTYHGLPEADLTRVVVDEVSVIGSRCGPFAPAIGLLARGAIDVESLIVERYSLDAGIEAMQRAGEKGMLKVLLDISG
jgi:threonine dehydrogenase-like Zn-dependent dehydrogenase